MATLAAAILASTHWPPGLRLLPHGVSISHLPCPCWWQALKLLCDDFCQASGESQCHASSHLSMFSGMI